MALAACGVDLGTAAQNEGIHAAALIRLTDTYAVAARRVDSRVEVLAFTADGTAWSARAVATTDAGADAWSAHLVSQGGDTGDEWNSFLYGTAGADASRVVAVGRGGQGGQVVGGAWVIAMRGRDIGPESVHWQVLDATGGVLASGSGISP
jgi:hypothetical protein